MLKDDICKEFSAPDLYKCKTVKEDRRTTFWYLWNEFWKTVIPSVCEIFLQFLYTFQTTKLVFQSCFCVYSS